MAAMEMPSISSMPRLVEDIFKSFSARRSTIVRALTSDINEFYSLCDPGVAHRRQYFFWKNYRNNRLKHSLPRPLPDPEPVAALAPAPAPALAPAALPPINSTSAPALSPMQFAGQPALHQN